MQEGDQILVHASVPGVDPKEINVTFENDTLVIRAESKAESCYSNGVLTVTFPKKESKKARTINIKTA